MNEPHISISTLTDLGTDDREAATERLEAAARTAWATGASRKCWTLFARLSFASHVSETTAPKHLEQWASDLRSQIPGTAIFAGLHSDTDRIHCHCLIYVPRSISDPSCPAGVVVVGRVAWQVWADACLGWSHGQLWADRFSPGRTAKHHGAALYLAKDVGTVMQFGVAPEYRPRRKR